MADSTFASDDRLAIDVCLAPGEGWDPAADVRAGLARPPRTLPPRYFYDARGSALFDAICDLPEYYLTRAEQALLERVAAPIVAYARPDTLVELGSGAARKTVTLLDALVGAAPAPTYAPVDISESMLRASAGALLARYPTLRVRGVVGDYERHLARAPRGGARLVAFLGSTIGNLDPGETARFLRAVRASLGPRDFFLLGVDLVKDPGVLERAYNDAAGVTAAFNKNVLAVLNRELDADFDLDRFDHVARYDRAAAQIEMHLRARAPHAVRLPRAGLTIALAEGETIRTEISRKFTCASVTAALAEAGLGLVRWDAGPDEAFALALAARAV